MKSKSKSNKIIDIIIHEEKFYFPGETIRGSIVVKPKSSIKTNGITVKFLGAIYILEKTKEVIPLFQEKRSISINNGKSKILEPKQYSFPFEFLVPENLPSAIDSGTNKLTRINYKIFAVLDRPMVPESLCPKADYPVLVLEYINVTKENYNKLNEKQKDYVSSQHGKCNATLSVEKTGYTRGETIPVKITLNTTKPLHLKDALTIELVRKVKVSSLKNNEESVEVLKSSTFDLNIIGPYNFSQSITSQLPIRNTPPTVRYRENVLKISYKIRAKINIHHNFLIELPIVIGTWPRADIPIDDDDDDDIIQQTGHRMISDESDEDEEWIGEQEELEFKRYSIHSLPLKKSNSNHSIGSLSSWNTQSTEHRLLPSSSTTTSLASPSTPIEITRNVLLPVQKDSINRSSSTPELINSNYRPPRRLIESPIRSSFYDTSCHRGIDSEDFSDIYVTQVPTQTLTLIPTQPQVLDESDYTDDSDFDEDDLLAVIERKRKKDLKRKQMLAVAV